MIAQLALLICILPVVRVAADDGSRGSGTCVASSQDSLIITAWHVVQDGKTFKVNGKQARLVATDKTWDLAALIVPGEMPRASIGVLRPEFGCKVVVCGYGSGEYKESWGTVLRYYHPPGESSDWVAVSAKARPGDSGGAIFDEHGTLVAVEWGSDSEGAHGTSCDRVRMFIKTLKINPKLKTQALSNPYVLQTNL